MFIEKQFDKYTVETDTGLAGTGNRMNRLNNAKRVQMVARPRGKEQHHNFYRVHKTLRVTPAMGSGISNHVWTLEELVSLLDGEQVVTS